MVGSGWAANVSEPAHTERLAWALEELLGQDFSLWLR